MRRIALVGFSTGGALSLRLAADAPPDLAGVAAISVPIRFQNRAMALVPLVHGANRLVAMLSSREGVMPFQPNASEHPHINYRHMPIRGLYEFRQLMDVTKGALEGVSCPLLVIQSTEDPTVVPQCA